MGRDLEPPKALNISTQCAALNLLYPSARAAPSPLSAESIDPLTDVKAVSGDVDKMLAIRQRTKLIVGIDYGTTYSGKAQFITLLPLRPHMLPYTCPTPKAARLPL